MGAGGITHAQLASRKLLAGFVVLATLVITPEARADLDTTPPVPTIKTSPQLTGVQTVSFNEPVLNVSSSNPVLRAAGGTEDLSTVRCRNTSNAIVPCTSSDVRRADLVPKTPMIPGRKHVILVNPDGLAPIVDGSANQSPKANHLFTASTAEQEQSAAAVYGWRMLYDSRAYGGSYQSERAAGSAASFAFTGPAVTWYTRLGPNEGKATVYIDGVSRGIVDNYQAASRMPAARGYRGLGAGSHTLTIVVRGEKSRASTGAWVAVDGMRSGSGALQDAAYRWLPVAVRGASAGRYARSSTVGDRVSFTFWGAGVDWFTAVGPEEGKVHLFIDNKFVRTHDNYAATKRFGVVRKIGGLPDAKHTMTIVVAGTKNARSKGTFVSVDRWVLRADAGVFRKLGAWIDLFDYGDETPTSVIQDRIDVMASHGVKTLYLQTGRYNTPPIRSPGGVGRWLDRAAAAGIRVVGWYLPAYSEYLQGDIDKTVAIASFSSPGGRRFDGLAIDIEYRRYNSTKTEFFNGIKAHLAGVRAGVGTVFPVGAITFAPLDMDRWPAGWSGFPWSSVATYANAVMPMSYWSTSDDRSRCSSGQADYCAYGFAKTNILRVRTYTGLPVHDIGGVGDRVTASEVAQHVKGTLDARAWGGSLYDYRTTSASFWASLHDLNAL
jgi:hypothetical protein